MAKNPTCPIYYNDILGSTKTWTDEEFGSYMRLLLEQWDKGFIPNPSQTDTIINSKPDSSKEDLDFQRLSMISPSVAKNWKMISKKFTIGEEGLFNARMEEIRKDLDNHKKKQSDNSNKRWKDKYTSQTTSQNYPKFIPLEDDNENEIDIDFVLKSIKEEIDDLNFQNYESKIKSNELANYFSVWLRRLGIDNVREYVAQTNTGRNSRFDLMVFGKLGSEKFIIEVKNYSRHDDYYRPLKQIERYSGHGLPIAFLPNFKTAYKVLISCLNFYYKGETDECFVFNPNAQKPTDLATPPTELKPVLWNDPIVIEVKKLHKKYFPDELEMPHENENFRLIAQRVAESMKFNKHTWVTENKIEVLKFTEVLFTYAAKDSWFSTKQLSFLVNNTPSLIKSYKQSLTPKINGNGKYSGISKEAGQSIEFD